MARKINFDSAPAAAQPEQGGQPHVPNRPLLGLERPIRQSGALGAISQSLGNINEKVRRAEEIEQKLVEGQMIVDLDPGLIDASFVRDRMDATEEQNIAFRELIREHGQASPILVRPHPHQPERFQVAFGHRRLLAARELGIKVRAVVRELSDEQLVVAQGQENSGRTDLTFIERARFAASLEDRKFSREVIMAALNVDKAAVSRLISIVSRVPPSIIDAIGPAPAFGRVRWQELSELLDKDANRKRAGEIVAAAAFLEMDTDKRFEAVYCGLHEKPLRSRAESWSAEDGTRAARVSRAGKKLTLTFDDRVAPAFGDFVKGHLQTLYEQYKAANKGGACS
ncbi:plasmid partitioning protein RepB [Methylovirgula sp. HY1]|uniref:plasmid partitioning protein RepB n=1 Tax=Methylovirgula sp. HY1 TaxID=2822761 RepID=UPI001C5B254B|nr:plasmid partitioning protein RepB [Methylovirgula sp. HY1]QXX76651.1 Chromosome-partitioning protein ParB [Methylovirgula sp. HY1]